MVLRWRQIFQGGLGRGLRQQERPAGRAGASKVATRVWLGLGPACRAQDVGFPPRGWEATVSMSDKIGCVALKARSGCWVRSWLGGKRGGRGRYQLL